MPEDPPTANAMADPSFRRLWIAALLAQSGSALGSVAVPLIAVGELGLSSATVALLATTAAVTILVSALPAGYVAEFRRKRPLMIGADLGRAAMFSLLAVLLLTGTLHAAWMFVALAVNAALQILFGSASSAHTKELLAPAIRADGLGKLQAATWTALILGPSAAGVLASVTSPAVLLLVNTATFVLSAVLVRSIPRPEGPPPQRSAHTRRSREALAGARFLLGEPMLRRLFLSWLLFAGAVAALTPVTQVFALRDLQFTSLQYGLYMGIPSLGGLAGAWVTGRVAARWRLGPTVWWSSLLRTPWYALYPLAAPGTPGLVLLVVAFTAVLFFSSITNSAMAALRMELTPDHLMSRSSAAWSIATMGAGPALIPLVGVFAQATSTRSALWLVFALVGISLLALPASRLLRPNGAAGPGSG
ncbi:MFS transporter [Brachybacterium horti]